MLYINGKFLGQRTTGVQRFARGLLFALDKSLAERPAGRPVVLLTPPGVPPLEGLSAIEQRSCGKSRRSLTWWEQVELPLYCRDGDLLCFSGSAPLFARRCIPTIHDAAVFLHPQAYSRKFVAWYRILFRRLARRSPCVLTVSESAAADLAEFLPRSKFRIVYNAAEHIVQVNPDNLILERHGLLGRRYILAVGSLNPTKNFEALLQAYCSAGFDSSTPLVIVGALNGSVFSQTDLRTEHSAIIWAGAVSDEQLRTLYENAALFVFPSLYEGFGIPPLEAMTCGCPVVASSASSIPEVCGDAALYFPPRDIPAVAASLLRVLKDESLRQELIFKGRRRSECFSWARSAEQLRSCLVDANYLSA
jgi:glycosyltransferase involved in cell wall biosynthesis